MKKLITVIALLMFAMFTCVANPKFTMLDYNCGNTPEYVNKILEDNDLTRVSLPITNKITKYASMFQHGTWLIENDGEVALISFYKGKPIFGTSVLIKHEEEDR